MFRHVELAPGVVQIQGPLGFCSTLVLGARRALLVDTMCGVGDLAGYVRQLTALPLIVCNSHGHFDHIGGNYQFESVWLPRLEYPAATLALTADARRDLACRLGKNGGFSIPESARVALVEQSGFDRFRPLEPGTQFDLGGVTAVAVALPGHTLGSTGLLLREKRILLSGDAMTPIMCLFFPDGAGLEIYKSTLCKAMALPMDFFVTAHHARLFPRSALDTFLACAEAVPTMRGLNFQHDIFPEYTGRLYIYQGENSGEEDFVALIGPDIPKNRKQREGRQDE